MDLLALAEKNTSSLQMERRANQVSPIKYPTPLYLEPGNRIRNQKVWRTKTILEHPCDMNNGGCAMICMRNGTKAECQCEEGFELNSDKATCDKGKQYYITEYIISVSKLN